VRVTASLEIAAELAEREGACVRPLVREVTDRKAGQVERVTLPCGSTRASVCPGCAERARRLRMHQCREGWHLNEEPLREPAAPSSKAEIERRVRSTRRRSDAAELPRVAVEQRSVGRTFTSPDGKVFRPSMFVTLTLGSYGRVVPGEGRPLNPGRYDYRRAAIEALLFPRLFDRWVQNLRRCAGYQVQYFGAIEPQRRLAPHIHVAIRGAIPRQVIKKVTQATYLQVWWPRFDKPVYDEEQPVWDRRTMTYVDRSTGVVLPSWEEAVDELKEPAAVLRFGKQLDIQGLLRDSADSDRRGAT
jgi:hypothetical protein